MAWRRSHRFDPRAVMLADRHYNRRKVGSPQFVPPSSNLVLLIPGQAVWTSSWPKAEYVRHAWPGAWVNSLFRREPECPVVASTLIRQAVAATRAFWGDPPSLGMLTFVDARKVRHKRDPGRCYLRAGFKLVGMTKGGLLAFQLEPGDMPLAEDALSTQGSLVFSDERSESAS